MPLAHPGKLHLKVLSLIKLHLDQLLPLLVVTDVALPGFFLVLLADGPVFEGELIPQSLEAFADARGPDVLLLVPAFVLIRLLRRPVLAVLFGHGCLDPQQRAQLLLVGLLQLGAVFVEEAAHLRVDLLLCLFYGR